MSNQTLEKRVELKYVVDSRKLKNIIDHILKNDYFFIKQHEDRKIQSLYFDSILMS